MSLTHTSTVKDALNQYNDNLSWEGSVTKAQSALEAVRWILANRPNIIASGERNVRFDDLQSEKEKLETFMKISDNVNRCSFTRGRMLL